MNIWTVVDFYTEGLDTTVYGVYSNCALAARAVLHSFKYIKQPDEYVTFKIKPTAWGYCMDIFLHRCGHGWNYRRHWGYVHIAKMTLNE